VADNMFVKPSVNIGGKRKYTVLMSIVAHTCLIAAAIVIPVVATDSIVPIRIAMIPFDIQPPLPPPLPPPRGAAKESRSIAQPAVPVDAPQGITPEIPIPSTAEPFAEIEISAGLVDGGEYSAPPPSTPPVPVPARVPLPVGGNIKRPVKVKDVAPAYPSMARVAQVKGLVIVEATIGPDGKVQDARILRSIPLLDAAALDAVRQWEYTPTLLNGTPIAIVMTVTLDFRLR
jgi:protein TonB